MKKNINIVHCAVCLKNDTPHIKLFVPGHTRKYKNDNFLVWQCSECKSIHCEITNKLDQLYENYPVHQNEVNYFSKIGYDKFINILKTNNITNHKTILDYGCGSGAFVKYLIRHDYQNVVGYEPYQKEYSSIDVLSNQYDVVFCIEVIEHVPTPLKTIKTLSELVKPNGIIIISTPRADGISLTDYSSHLFSLHAPFHINIFSESKLINEFEKNGFNLKQVFKKPFFFDWLPFTSRIFVEYFLKLNDNLIDTLYEKIPLNLILKNPKLWFYALFGGFLKESREDYLILVMQKNKF